MRNKSQLVLLFGILYSTGIGDVRSKKADPENKPSWAKKDLNDFNDADLERLYDQWEEDDEPLPDDEIPDYLKPPKMDQGLNFDNIGEMSQDQIMKMTKKGKTVMMFITISDSPTRNECEELTSLWQGALRNNHIQAERYVVEDNRAIFLFHDGAQAWDAKEFLLEQDRLYELSLESQVYKGKRVNTNADEGEKKKQEL